MQQDFHLSLTFDKVQNPLRLPRKTTSQPSKVVRTSRALCILNWKCASRHNSVQLFSTSARQKVVRACSAFNILIRKATTACVFFDISTFKGGLGPSVFDTFDLEMCFAPHRRALFRHLKFQKCSDVGIFCAWLGNLLRCAISTWCLMPFLT